jgi:hypothetical protein
MAALAVGGTAAAVVGTGSSGSPTVASPPVSSSAESITTNPTSGTSDATEPASDSQGPSSATRSSDGTPRPAPSTVDSSLAADPETPTGAESNTSASVNPTCLGTKEAFSLAQKLNGGSLPADAKISVLRCDDGWAAGRLASASYGDASIVYEYDGAQWNAVDLGTAVCEGVVRGAPTDVRKALNC